ncbi:VPLPA-CTERM sorting domain-containing protein [Roseovarius sp. S1116L3]|uniref:VPLPA-CTERM sorting domain-containing protein n=1 Tax=Roseovarius roseus TaxID=3342636 RepID=UPI00372BF141
MVLGKYTTAAFASAMAVGLCGPAFAVPINLTTDGSSYTQGKVTFTAKDFAPTAGTGVINPFLTIQNNTIEEGYNSGLSNSGFEFDEKRSPGFTRALTFGNLVEDSGFYSLFGDWNEPNGGGKDTLSFLTFDIWADTDGQNNSFGTGAFTADNLLFSLGTQIDTVDFSGGSGQGDMEIKIEKSLFDGIAADSFFMLHVVLGKNCTGSQPNLVCTGYASDGGFEEFATEVKTPLAPVPLPAAGWLLIAGLGGLAAVRRRKRPA